MPRPFLAAVLAAALTACTGAAGKSEFGSDGVIVPAGACAADRPDLVEAEPIGPVNGSDGCGIAYPRRLLAIANVRLSVPATLACAVVPPLQGWLADIVQPAAVRAFGERVAGVDVAASYVCRPRNGNPGAKISEHGHGNAIDISAFTLASGRKVTVAAGWYGSTGERAFLREVHDKACGRFSTVLGPDADHYHRNHIHLDIRHRNNGIALCQ